jgi:hypothetical protein
LVLLVLGLACSWPHPLLGCFWLLTGSTTGTRDLCFASTFGHFSACFGQFSHFCNLPRSCIGIRSFAIGITFDWFVGPATSTAAVWTVHVAPVFGTFFGTTPHADQFLNFPKIRSDDPRGMSLMCALLLGLLWARACLLFF